MCSVRVDRQPAGPGDAGELSGAAGRDEDEELRADVRARRRGGVREVEAPGPAAHRPIERLHRDVRADPRRLVERRREQRRGPALDLPFVPLLHGRDADG